MMKTILIAAITLVVGLLLGFFVGRYLLERKWSAPYTQIWPGTKGLVPMPIARSRVALRTMTADDAVVSNIAAIGAGDEGRELHVVVENRGKCTITSLAGIAYGFDAYGKPSALLASGEHFVPFDTKTSLESGKKFTVAKKLESAEDATLAIAHIDRTTCADGTTWSRR